MARALLAALVITLAALSAAAFPDGPPPFPPEGRPEQLVERYAADLGISEATVAQIRTLAEQNRAETEVMVKELQAQKLALREKLHAPQPSESEVIALARTIGTLETDLSVARLTSMMRIHALLTPEQNEALHEKMRGRFVERRALLDQTLTACEADIAAHCADANADGPPGHPLMCLMHQRDTQQITLSAPCEQALREIPPPRMFFHRRVGPPGEGGEKFDVLVAPPGEMDEPAE